MNEKFRGTFHMNKQNKTIVLTFIIGSFAFLILSMTNYIYALFGLALIALSWVFIMFISGKWGLYHYIITLIVSIILSPLIELPLWTFKLDDFWLIFGVIVFIFKITFVKDINFKLPSYARMFLVFILWIGITLLISVFKEVELYSFRDWTELYKNGKLLIYLLIGLNVKLNKEKQEKIINVAIGSLLISALFGIAQYFNLFNVNQLISPYYIFETKYSGLLNNKRVVGTFANPNIFGGALLIGIALSFSKLLNKFKFKYLISLFIFFIALAMSLSRTSILVCVILVFLMIISVLVRSNKKIPALLTLFFSPFLLLVVSRFVPEKLYSRLSEFQDLQTTGSWQVRLNNWKNIFENRTKDNFIVGTGPTSGMPITFDNEWLMILTHYGAIGVLIFLSLFTMIYYNLGKVRGYGFYYIALRSLMISFSVYMMFLPVFSVLQLMPIIILLMGITLNNSATTQRQNEL